MKKANIQKKAISRAVEDLLRVLDKKTSATNYETSLPDCELIHATILNLREAFPDFVSPMDIESASQLLQEIRLND